MSNNPNIIERLENLLAALEEADRGVNRLYGNIEDGYPCIGYREAKDNIDMANGIAGEILTMIDGR